MELNLSIYKNYVQKYNYMKLFFYIKKKLLQRFQEERDHL